MKWWGSFKVLLILHGPRWVEESCLRGVHTLTVVGEQWREKLVSARVVRESRIVIHSVNINWARTAYQVLCWHWRTWMILEVRVGGKIKIQVISIILVVELYRIIKIASAYLTFLIYWKLYIYINSFNLHNNSEVGTTSNAYYFL